MERRHGYRESLGGDTFLGCEVLCTERDLKVVDFNLYAGSFNHTLYDSELRKYGVVSPEGMKTASEVSKERPFRSIIDGIS